MEPKKEVSPTTKPRRRSKVDWYLPDSMVDSVGPVPWANPPRPPLADDRKGHSLQFRARPALRSKLDDAASATGRSLSEEIEHRLMLSFDLEARDKSIATLLGAVIGLVEKK